MVKALYYECRPNLVFSEECLSLAFLDDLGISSDRKSAEVTLVAVIVGNEKQRQARTNPSHWRIRVLVSLLLLVLLEWTYRRRFDREDEWY